jgi:hypothetical protein
MALSSDVSWSEYETLIGVCRPKERLRIAVVMLQIFLDGFLQTANARKRSASDPLIGDLPKEPFDLIHPLTGSGLESN